MPYFHSALQTFTVLTTKLRLEKNKTKHVFAKCPMRLDSSFEKAKYPFLSFTNHESVSVVCDVNDACVFSLWQRTIIHVRSF